MTAQFLEALAREWLTKATNDLTGSVLWSPNADGDRDVESLTRLLETVRERAVDLALKCERELACVAPSEPPTPGDGGWREIASAPKTGVAIMFAHGNWITTGSWHRTHECWINSGPTYEPFARDEQPTHWMPLPSPPQAVQERE